MKTSVVTVASGRHDHLRAQLYGLSMSTIAPDLHVVVSMGDRQILDITASQPRRVETVMMPASGPLPLARARNVGAEVALENGADVLVFLDVDCVPHHRMIARYSEVAAEDQHAASLLCGPVTYLPANTPVHELCAARALGQLTKPHPDRPHPDEGAALTGGSHELFWSLSFAMRAQAWQRIGGFWEGYSGYGGEDTDFGQCARSAGIGLSWVGGAHAYHQYHSVSDPPFEHLDDIVRNAAVFERRWGWWPMRGWLEEFAAAGLADYDAESNSWRRRG